MHPRYGVEKTYRARLDRPLTRTDKKTLEQGILLDGRKTASCNIIFLGKDARDVRITIHEGKNRHVHRMFHTRGYTVRVLDRIEYAGLTAKGLARGEWRYLTKKETEVL
jgi:23S rRNA pseudouridine2605 synthase